jgi:hypothetical protein
VRERLEIDRTARGNLLVPLGGQLDDRGFLFASLELAADAGGEAPHDLVLLDRAQVDEHDDAVAEQGGDAVGAGAEREGRGRQGIAALEPGDIEAVTDQERAGGDAVTGRERERRGHRVRPGAAQAGNIAVIARSPKGDESRASRVSPGLPRFRLSRSALRRTSNPP